MANEENIIDRAIDANIEARMADDNALRSVTSKVIQAEKQGLPGTQAWLDQSAALRGGELGSSEAPPFAQGALPGWVSGVTVDNLGMLNRAVDWDMLELKGDDPNRGLYDYFKNTFRGAFSGEDQPGEMFVSWEELDARPDLQEWLDNAEKGMEQNAIRLMDEFMEDKKFRTEDDYFNWVDEMFDKESRGELTEEERKDINYIQKLQSQRDHPMPAVTSPDKKGILITSNTLPDIAHEPDPKFVDGRLQLPYLGTFERNEEGELTMPAASMFRFTDNPGIPGLAETYAPDAEKAFGDYLYPKISPWWDYGESGEEQMGYQVGQMLSGAQVLKTVGKPIIKGGYKAGKGLYNLVRRKLFGYEPVDTSSWNF